MFKVIIKFKDEDEVTCYVTGLVLNYWQTEASRHLNKYGKIISVEEMPE